MLLTVDLGNTFLKGAWFQNGLLKEKFIINSQFLVFENLLSVLRSFSFSKVLIASVVPHLNLPLKAFFKKYFNIIPLFTNELKCPFKVLVPNPEQIGADLLAGLVGAQKLFPNTNLIVVDLGTIITFTVLTAAQEILGAVFYPCKEIIMQAMHQYASQLPLVKLEELSDDLGWGVDTESAMSCGLHYGQKGALRAILAKMQERLKLQAKVVVTGGGGKPLANEYDYFPDLILTGLAEWWKWYDK